MKLRNAILALSLLLTVGAVAIANEFYNASGAPAQGSAGSSSAIRSEFSSIASGFNLLPTMGGNTNNLVTVNNAGTALVATTPFTSGTWTPSVGGTATYTSRTGTYYKIGKLVIAGLSMQINAIGTGSTTVISGLPAVADASQAGTACYAYYWGSSASTITTLVGNISSSTITLWSTTVAAANLNTNSIFQNNTQVFLNCTYVATS